MRKKSLKIFFVLILILTSTSLILAQRQTGSVTGKVSDEEGIPLPGAAVTLSGPAMMGYLTFTTTESGDFRFPAVPPGSDYTLTVEMPGFKTIKREGIIVNVGKTVTIVIQMEAATIEEEITVTAESPTVDVTSTKISVSYSEDLIKNVPLARDFYDIIKAAPGIVSEEVQFHRSFSAHGGTVRSNQVTLDGVTITDPAVGTNMMGIPFDVYEEFEFELGAHPAEVGMTEGAFINIVTKSGGNEFHGQLNAYFFNKNMVRSLIPDSEVEAVGLKKPTGNKRWLDTGFSLGGPFLKDKLWFFTHVRYLDWAMEGELFRIGIIEAPHKEIQTFNKLTLKPSPAFQLTGMWAFKNWDEPILTGWGIDYYSEKYSNPSVDNARDHTILAMVNWILNQNTFFDFRFNYFWDFDPWHLHPDLDPNTPSTIDIVTGVWGGSTRFNEDYTAKYTKFQIAATRFQDNFIGGNHEVKAGLEYQRAYFTWDWFKKNPYWHLLANGDPWCLGPGVGMFYILTMGENKGDTPQSARIRRWSAYLQDSFTIADRLTLNLGVRYDESHGDVLGGTFTPVASKDPVATLLAPNIFRKQTVDDANNLMLWKDFSPRLGAVFDVFGDGKTSLKASWSRYNEFLMLQYFMAISPVYPDYLTALWIDLNLNRSIEATDYFIVLYTPLEPEDFRVEDRLDPKHKSPYTDEFILGVERELFRDVSLGISYYYKKKGRVVEDVDWLRGNSPDSGWWVPYTVKEPGWDGEFGTEDDANITVYAVKEGAPELRYVFTNPKGAVRKYQGVEFIINKRMSNRWQFLGSLTLSKFEGNIGANYGATWGFSGAFDDPNWFVNRYGRLDMDRPVQLKLQGSVMLPLDFMLSAYYFHVSGAPWGRTLRIYFPPDPSYDATNPPYVEVQAEPPGKRRFRSRNNMDARVEKLFNLGKMGQLGIFLDVLNVFGESWFDVNQDPGGWILPDGSFVRWPNYGQFYKANGLRTFKVSARFSF